MNFDFSLQLMTIYKPSKISSVLTPYLFVWEHIHCQSFSYRETYSLQIKLKLLQTPKIWQSLGNAYRLSPETFCKQCSQRHVSEILMIGY